MTQPTLFDLEAPAACEWCGAEGGGVFKLAGKPAPKVRWYATREAFLCEFCHANGAPPSPEPSLQAEAADVFREDWLPRPADEFGEYLRGLRVPYVDVCEAERAVFSTDQPMERFDYLVYSESGPNLLVAVIGEDGPLNSDLSLLDDWQRVFGRDFAGTMVFRRDGVWVALTLDDWQDFPNLAHTRALDLLL